ncbi:ABC transporter ATP-binding protein [Caproicibacter fermentans]|uniref:ABC transporter ATP-binding protein n=1 Tax=Caproicibacter fermentans TaxID=2576756 RepID=A0A7G8TAN2_9FIRM|nr:ABC transporter ATP-binding protein [Caproicibacter fermentans]QNK40673.1 ABC transporter ATP-binding protein [Caproicibacter fermentans]
MLKLVKYLKPYAALILIAVMLLGIQVVCDLSLPNYMSDIVNQGIQQGGIVNAVPQAIRQSEMNKLTLFMNANEKKEVLADYTLLDRSALSTDAYGRAVSQYPALAKEAVYQLNSIDNAENNRLNSVLGKAFVAVSLVDKLAAQAESGPMSLGGTTIPKGTDLYGLLQKLPASQLEPMRAQINQKIGVMTDSAITQSAVLSVKTEYQAIGMDTDKIQSGTITRTGLWMLLFALLSAACTVLVEVIGARVSAGFSMDLRRQVFTKVESFSSREFDRFSTSSLITRTTNDVTQIQTVVFMVIRMMIYAPLIGVGGAVMALQKSTSMSWMIAVAVIILVGIILTLFSFCLPKFELVQKLTDKLNLVTRESLSGMLVIRAFNTQKFEEKRFDGVNSDITKTNLFVNRAMATLMPALTLIMNGMSLLIVWVGGHQIAQSGMQVGDMMAFMQYAMQIFSAFIMISVLFIMLPRASVSARRIAEVIDTDLSVKDPERPEAFSESQKGTVEFKNVHFRYHGAERDALSNISFTALPGQTTAIIGSAGSGKTTLVNLIPRFYDVTEGKVLVDGIDVRKVSQHALRERIGYVPQKSSLFQGTVESNLKYADEHASEDTLQKAAEISQSMEFLASKPKGFETEIAQGGKNVSGGQRQRLSIARALVKKPEILIFDDSFSALDFKTDSLVRKALNSETGDSTVILIAQRISSIMGADQILVLEEGRIAGIGRHDELMETCETYREIALSQLSKEELA